MGDASETDGALTFMQLFEAMRVRSGERVGVDAVYSADMFEARGLAMFGGCVGCEESLGAYNGYPDRRGYWACRACLEQGYASLEEFEADNELGAAREGVRE